MCVGPPRVLVPRIYECLVDVFAALVCFDDFSQLSSLPSSLASPLHRPKVVPPSPQEGGRHPHAVPEAQVRVEDPRGHQVSQLHAAAAAQLGRARHFAAPALGQENAAVSHVSHRIWNNWKRLKIYFLKAKTRIWPCLSYMRHTRSEADSAFAGTKPTELCVCPGTKGVWVT